MSGIFSKTQDDGGHAQEPVRSDEADSMTQTILRLYQAREHALVAARELLKSGFAVDQVVLVVSRDVEEEPADVSDSMRDEVSRMGIHEDDAPHYAASLRRGGSMVKVDAPHHRADEAARILDDHGPVTSPDSQRGSAYMTDREAMQSLSRGHGGGARAEGDVEPSHDSGSDDPAPLSHALHLPTLSDDPAPLSHFLHIPVLSED